MKVDEGTVGLALRELAEHTQPSPSPVAAIMQRGRRARRTRRAGLAGACAGLAAIVVTAVGLAQTRPAADEPMTPQMRLAAALEATGQSSFRLRISTSDPYGTGHPATYTGAYDPVAHNGYLNGNTGTGPQRIVGGILYVQQSPDTWVQYGHCGPGFYFYNRKTGDGATLSRAGLSANPTLLLDLLRGSGTVTALGRQGSGAKAVDRYRFVAAVQASPPGSTDCGEPRKGTVFVTYTIAGVVEVGVKSGKVGNMTYQEPMLLPTGEPPNVWQASTKYQVTIVIQMSDYGLPVVVKAPIR